MPQSLHTILNDDMFAAEPVVTALASYERHWQLDHIEHLKDLAWLICHVLQPRLIHMKVWPREPRQDHGMAPTAFMNFVKAVCIHQQKLGGLVSVQGDRRWHAVSGNMSYEPFLRAFPHHAHRG